MSTPDFQGIYVTCERLFSLLCTTYMQLITAVALGSVFIIIHQTFIGLTPGCQYLRSVLSRRFRGVASIGAALGGISFENAFTFTDITDTTDSCVRFACKIYT